MKINNRPYNELHNDFKKLLEFIGNDFKEREGDFVWSLGRISDWKYGIWNENKYIPSFLRKNAQLWFDNEILAGFLISEEGDNSFTIFSKKEYRHIYSEIISWLKSNWKDRGNRLITEMHETQLEEINILLSNGFVDLGEIAITRKYQFAEIDLSINLPIGYSIVDMNINANYVSKKEMQNNAFRQDIPVTEFDILAYEYNRESPVYNAKYDMSVIDSNGKHVAGCMAFVDYDNEYAEIERVCTHSDYRRLGLCEALLKECFKRLSLDNIKCAYLTGFNEKANGLYAKLGSCYQRRWNKYVFEV
ncbi:MAG: GNAT family N-acetyltransferase [Fibrobacteres bacterium]|nr:GNAT family N-acetyltransferase [Fibrobacterota bacterium]